MLPKDTQVASLIGELKGAPASIILTMLLLGRPLRRKDLITYTRYSGPTIDKALDRLQLLSIIQQPPAQKRYTLTTDARQFILGEQVEEPSALPEPAPDDGDSKKLKNFYFTKVGSSNNDILDLDLDTTTLVEKPKKILPEGPAQQAAELLIEGGIVPQLESGKGAEDSVAAALESGWKGEQCLRCVQGWLDYAKTSSGEWINQPYAMAAAKLRQMQMAPRPAAERKKQSRRSKYAPTSGKWAGIGQT